MALLGNYLTVRLQSHSSGTANEVIAETTSVDCQFNADALETTSQTDGLNAGFIVGKNTIQVSGDYLMASDGEQFDLLFVHMNAGDKIEVDIYRSSTKILSTEGVFTSLSEAGANSDALVTGAYSMELDATALDAGVGPELLTNGDFSAWTTDDPDGWTVSGESGADPMVTEVATDKCRMYTSSAMLIIQQIVMTIGLNYRMTVVVDAADAGAYKFGDSGGDLSTISTTGTHSLDFTAAAVTALIRRSSGAGDDMTFTSASLKQIL